jgi:LysM repeat protein
MIKNILLALLFSNMMLQKGVSQTADLFVTNMNNTSIINHAVQAKENWYSIGRLYNVHPKELAVYNKTAVDKGLKIGQLVQVPITANNRLGFFDNLQEGEAKFPFYYLVKKGDILNKIAILNNTTREVIRSWNNFTSDSIFVNQKLLVGYLKVKYAESALVNANLSAIPTYTTPPTDVKASTANNTTELKQEPIKSLDPKEQQPNVVKVEAKPNQPTIVHTKANTITPPSNEKPIVENPIPKPDKPKQSDIAVKQVPNNIEKQTTAIEVKTVTPELNTVGYYSKGFKKGKSIKTIDINNCGTFKANAGWDDDKYFITTDAAPVGSVVKLMNPSNNKTVYAMVLDNNGMMKKVLQNDCNISNATAYALGIKETKMFNIKIEMNQY